MMSDDSPLSTVEWLARVGEIRRLARAYDRRADDRPGQPGESLTSYLRSFRRHGYDLSRLAVLVWQIREFLDEDWVAQDTWDVVERIGLPQPPEGQTTAGWLAIVADLIEDAIDGHQMPPDAPPSTSYEWTAAYPDVTTLISTAFHQDAFVLHATLERALAQALRDVHVLTIARAAGQIQEILTLGLTEATLDHGVHWMGLSVRNPAVSYAEFLQWLQSAGAAEVAHRAGRADGHG